MDYVVGSIAALISGNVTPNRPKLIRRALTPTKHQSSPNVTPKSEAVADRSIFLSPSVQKKKAIVKKSPKRIFENPDLDVTENSDSLSPKADKVKKHLEGELEADAMGKSSIMSKKSPSSKLDKSPSSKLDKNLELVSTNKKSKINDSQASNENTPKKKKKKSEFEVTEMSKSEVIDVDQPTVLRNTDRKSPKKMKKLIANDIDNQTEVTKATDKSNLTDKDMVNNQGKKKNKKRKKNKGANKEESTIIEKTNNDSQIKAIDESNSTEAKSLKIKKNRKNKNKKAKPTIEVEQNKPYAKIEESDDETKKVDVSNDKTDAITRQHEESDDETEEITNEVDGNESDDETEEITNEVDGNESDHEEDEESESDDEVSNIANPNAITEKDSDSEHDSDDEIDSSENEESNKDTKTDEADDSSDDESQAKTKKGKQKKKDAKQKKDDNKEVKEDGLEKEVNTEEEIKRTLFVGNVPFSNKCKKEIKKIFSQYGEIETVRIRTVPVKDARVTPKLAVIKNEIHPDRSTVNVYVKFADPESVELALAENNTVLNHHHLRVTRSAATGVEHDPHRAVFLGNLPFGIEDETLRAKFEKCGDIVSVRIVRDKKTNAGKGFGYVNFASKDGVELALELSEEDLTVKNRIIRVKRCTQTHNKGPKKGNKPMKHGPRKDGQSQGQNSSFGNNQVQRGNGQGPNGNFGNNQRNFGNNQGPNRSFGNNQGPNRNFGNNQGQNRNFGNNQGQNRNFGNNQGQNRNFGNNQGSNRNFGNNQGPNRNFGNNQGPRNFGNRFGNQGNEAGGASRRIMNKRPHQENGDGPPNKKQHLTQPPREKKQRKEFVGITAEKKKKQKFDKGQKKKKAISEIMTKKT